MPAQHGAARHEPHHQPGEQQAPDERTDIDVQVHPAHPLLLLLARQDRHLRQPRDDRWNVLQHAERQRVAAGDQQGGEQT